MDEDEKERGSIPQTRGLVWMEKNAGIREIRGMNDPENKEGCSRMLKTCYSGCLYHHARTKDRKQLKGERIYFGSWLKVSQRGWFDSGSRSSGDNSWGVCLLSHFGVGQEAETGCWKCLLSLSLFFSSDQDPGPGGVLPTFSVVLPLLFPLEMPSS